MTTRRIVRPLVSARDEAALKKILLQCFEFPPARWKPWSKIVGRENLRIVTEGGRVLGGLGALPEGQWFGGRLVPSGAIVAVGVAPEDRYSGAARELMSGVLHELRERGFALSVLFASTQRVYRSVGFEQSGNRVRYQAATRNLPRGPLEVPVIRLDEKDRTPLESIHRTRAILGAGHLERTEPLWTRLLGRETVYRYILGSRKDPEGMVLFVQQPVTSGYTLDIRDMTALTPRAARTLWRFLAGHSSLSRVIEWEGPGTDPLALLLPENDAVPIRNERWLMRVLDPMAALEARGYAPQVEAQLLLKVEDETIRENAGMIHLEVGSGEARATRIRRKPRSALASLRVGARGLAPLYSGFLPARALRAAGWIEADQESIEVAERIFRGPEPWMPDDF